MRVNMTPVIDFDELEMEFGKQIHEYYFYMSQEQKTGYFWLNLNDEAIADLDWLKEHKKWMREKFGYEYDEGQLDLIENDKALIDALRALGYTTEVLIYVFE